MEKGNRVGIHLVGEYTATAKKDMFQKPEHLMTKENEMVTGNFTMKTSS